MFKRIFIVGMLVMIMFLSTGCIEVAWNNEGHISTQAPKLVADNNGKYGWDYTTPLPSNETVNTGTPGVGNQQQPIVIVMPSNQQGGVPVTYAKPDFSANAVRGVSIIRAGNYGNGGR